MAIHDKAEKTHIWETKMRRTGFYDPENKYSKMLQQGMPQQQVIDMAKDAGDYLGKVDTEGNVALNAGLAQIIDLIIGAQTTPTWATPYIGVGDSATAAVATQTALQAATNKAYAAMDSTYPKRSSQTVQFKSTFAAGVASFTWQEVIVLTGNGTGTGLNRKVGAWGTKGASDSYSMEVDVTLS
ncbi:MAG: hypothetical protein GXX95_01260 [Methanomassiliicoccus sp.]|nr:hypothetical protein [Methanomassiliicoccus sp.]